MLADRLLEPTPHQSYCHVLEGLKVGLELEVQRILAAFQLLQRIDSAVALNDARFNDVRGLLARLCWRSCVC